MERPDPCEDLEKYFDRNEDVDEEMAKTVILQLVNSLKHCESRGVLHRDVKPENVLICTDTGELTLLDFGCRDFLKDSYREYAGTALYAPPELFRFRQYQARPTTVWSVDITPYEVLFGSIPFSTTEKTIKHRLSLPTFLSKGNIKRLNKGVICSSVLLKTRTMFVEQNADTCFDGVFVRLQINVPVWRRSNIIPGFSE